MGIEKIAGLAALGWLVVAVLSMGRSIRRGQALADALAMRHPDVYEALGRPRPGYLDSLRRDRWARFVARREYGSLGDPPLAAEFEAYRTAGARLVVAIIASMVVVCLALLIVRRGL